MTKVVIGLVPCSARFCARPPSRTAIEVLALFAGVRAWFAVGESPFPEAFSGFTQPYFVAFFVKLDPLVARPADRENAVDGLSGKLNDFVTGVVSHGGSQPAANAGVIVAIKDPSSDTLPRI
jgi:hypothetical protein